MKKTVTAVILIAIMCVSIFTAVLPKTKADDNTQSSNSNGDQNSWPMFQHDSSHTGFSLSDVTASNQSQWRFKTQNQIWGAPVIAYGAVYVGSLDSNVYAVNSSTGNKIWNYATGTAGDVIESTPAVDNSVVYAGSSDGNIYALNASTGSKIWSYQTGQEIDSSPTVASGIIYAGSYDGIMYALNSTTGNKIWSYDTTPQTTYANPTSPAVDNGFVYFGGFNDNLYALNALNGKSLWNFTAGGWIYTPAVDNGVVYFGSDDNHVYALNATTGIEMWNYQAKGPVFSSPAFANGVVYAGSRDGNVYALNATTGSEMWSYQTGNTIPDSPAVVSGAVFIGSTENLYVLNATNGNELRVYPIVNPTSAAFANGNVYVGSSDGNLYSFCSYGSLTSLNLSSNSASAGSSVICKVEVSGANPTGTVTWKTSSDSGTFSSEITTLNSGTSSATYIDTDPGKALITAIYSGDANNVPSNQTASLELLNASLPTMLSVVQSGTLNSDIAAFNGTLINVDVRIDEAYSVWAYAVYLNWTPSVLKLLKVTEGPYLDQAGNTFFLDERALINNTAGTIEGGIADGLASNVAASGSGVLSTLEFQAIGLGNANITIDPLNTIIAPSAGISNQGISISFQVANASVYVVAQNNLQWTAIDFFNNGKVDATDFFFWMDAYIQYNSNGVYTAACDLNHDGKIDNVDFFLFMSYYISYGESLTENTS